jgi:uncharacterized membrane protein (Fun14 family)
MNLEHFRPFTTSIGFGCITGFLIEFAVKKIMKILAVGVSAQNIGHINWAKLQTISQSTVSTLANSEGLIPVLANMSTANFALLLTGSMATGFAIGFMGG